MARQKNVARHPPLASVTLPPVQLADGLLLVSAALHGAASVFHVVLYQGTRRPEHRAFARFAGSVCVYILANAVLAARAGEPIALVAATVLWFVGSLAIGALRELSSALVDPIPKAPNRVYALGLALSASTVFGSLALDPDPEAALAGHPTQPIAWALMAVHSTVAFLILASAVLELARGAVHKPELRGLLLGLGAAVSLGLLDELLRWVTGARPHLSEHAGALTVAASTLALADRQVRFASELDQKSRDLGEAHSQLAHAQQLRGRKEPLAALGELSAVVAHEVRNPLAIVKNAVSSLRRPALAPEDRETLLEIIGEEAGRLSRLVRDLLAFARPRAARESAIQVSALVHRAVRDATRGAAELVARIEVQIEGSTTLVGDPELLRLALSNLVENALHATAEGGKVRILARDAMLAGQPSVLLAVEDEGQGMSEDVALKARDPFFTTRATGTGLGLAIVERVMRSHGGILTIESAIGEGSTVSMTIPLEHEERRRLSESGEQA